MKNEPKTCSIPYSHTSYHNSGQTNFDVVGKSGRISTNNVNNPEKSRGKVERADGAVIKIDTNKD